MTSMLARTTWVLLALAVALAGCTKSSEELLESAKQRVGNGDRVGAIIDLKAAIQSRPDDASMRFMLGRLYNETFDGASAEKELKLAREGGLIEGGRVAVELARALRAQGKHNELLETVEVVDVYESEQRATIHALRGRSYYALRRIAEAKKSLEAAQSAANDVSDAVLLAASIDVAEGRPEQGLAALSTLLQKRPDHFDAARLKAQLLVLLDKEDQALEAYGALLNLHPTYFGALVGRSNLLLKRGRYDEA